MKPCSVANNMKTYNGGFSDEPFRDSHGIALRKLYHFLFLITLAGYTYYAVGALSMANALKEGINDRQLLFHFLAARQTTVFELDDESSDNESNLSNSESQDVTKLCIGFNGRLNKLADTCYVW
jgi:prenyltransferase beta subunit